MTKKISFKLLTNPQQILPFFDAIKALADSDKSSLGFLPEQALRDGICRKKMLALVDPKKTPNILVGYLLYSGVFPNAKVQQVATAAEYRNMGVGSSLIESLVSELEKLGFLSIRADVASDLDVALQFYSKNGFEAVRTQPGGTSRQRKIVLHARTLETETLFTRVSNSEQGIDLGISRRSAGETPFFALDLNVYFDLAKERPQSETARRLFGSALGHEIRLTVADEFVKELSKTSTGIKNDPILQLALRLPRMPPVDPNKHKSIQNQMHELIFVQAGARGAGSSQALSDAGHVAHAALARASAFVTRDNAILNSRYQLIETFGIDVISVEELSSLLPADRNDNQTGTRSGIGFTCIDPQNRMASEYFIKQKISKNLIEEFAGKEQQSLDRVSRAIRQGNETLACAVLLVPRNTEPVCRLLIHALPQAADGHFYLDHLLDLMLAKASENGAVSIELEFLSGQSNLTNLAKSRGFRKQAATSTLAKIAIGRPITTTNWRKISQELKLKTGLKLPHEMPHGSDMHSFSILTKAAVSIDVSLTSLEGIIGPTILIWPERDGVVVPITRSYSEQLLGATDQLLLGLLDEKDASFLSRRAYVNTPRRAKLMRPDAPILFYESLGRSGKGAIVAVARIVDSLIVDKRDVPTDYSRRLVVEDIDGISSSEDVLVTSFDNVLCLPNPVSFQKLKQIGAADGTNFVSTTPVSGELITQILDWGWSNA